MEMSSSEGIKRAVEANLGIAVLSRNIIINEIKNKSLVALSIKDLLTLRDFYIVKNKKRNHLNLMMKFYDFILEKSKDAQLKATLKHSSTDVMSDKPLIFE
jgi:DNA-binding transcriptional LysR family regulator